MDKKRTKAFLERPSWFTADTFERYLKEGYSRRRIASDILFVNISTANRWFKELAIQERTKLPRPSWFTCDVYETYRRLGLKHTSIRAKLKVSEPVYNRFLAELGVKKDGRRNFHH